MTELRVKAEGIPETIAVLRKARPDAGTAWIGKALLRAGFLVQKLAAEKYIVRGRAKGAPPLPNRLTRRSGSGGLVDSITTDRVAATTVVVGTNKIYAPLHEFGLGHFDARPFMQPATDEASQDFEAIFRRAWSEQLP